MTTAREYVLNTVIPALKLAGHEITAPKYEHGYHYIRVSHMGEEDLIRVWADYQGYRDCVSLLAHGAGYRARPSKFLIDRNTGAANIPGILSTAMRLVREARQRIEITDQYEKARNKEQSLYESNLPLLKTLANEIGCELFIHDKFEYESRFNYHGIVVSPSKKYAGAIAIIFDTEHHHVLPSDARAFLAAATALKSAAMPAAEEGQP